MAKIVAILLFATTWYKTSLACINGETLILKNGTLLYEDGEEDVPHGHVFNVEELANTLLKLDSLYKATKDLDYLSDKGLVLILLKKYDQAIKLYLEIEKKEPNRYSTASNIGTAYELMGKNEEALKWIKKCVQLDPNSHKGSEWIHVKVLEAKIKGPESYNTSFLLNTGFGTAPAPISTLTRQEMDTLRAALYFQLNERISFVKPKEQIVAHLLFDLGNLTFLLGEYYTAKENYKLAKRYGFANALIEKRIKEAGKLLEARNKQNKVIDSDVPFKSRKLLYGLSAAGAILLGIVIISISRRRKKA